MNKTCSVFLRKYCITSCVNKDKKNNLKNAQFSLKKGFTKSTRCSFGDNFEKYVTILVSRDIKVMWHGKTRIPRMELMPTASKYLLELRALKNCL